MRRPAAPQRRTLVLSQQGRHAMSTATVRTPLVLVLALLVLGVLGATSSVFACVVGTGTSAGCTEAALDACLPGGGSFDGTVTFACGGAATITVTSQKTISADTTIDGGSVITISGGNTVSGGAVELASGGALTVTNSTFSVTSAGNGAGGGAGGAIHSSGTLNVTNSTFSGNGASDGGGIGNFGSATVTNSTFSGNSANG